jgi:hypothetical protein
MSSWSPRGDVSTVPARRRARRHQVSRRRPRGDVPHTVTGWPGARRAGSYADPGARRVQPPVREDGARPRSCLLWEAADCA